MWKCSAYWAMLVVLNWTYLERFHWVHQLRIRRTSRYFFFYKVIRIYISYLCSALAVVPSSLNSISSIRDIDILIFMTSCCVACFVPSSSSFANSALCQKDRLEVIHWRRIWLITHSPAAIIACDLLHRLRSSLVTAFSSSACPGWCLFLVGLSLFNASLSHYRDIVFAFIHSLG